MQIFVLSTFLFLATLPTNASSILHTAESEGQKYKVELLQEGLKVPWSMAFINDSQMIITERPGAVKLYDLKTSKLTPITGTPKVYASGQAGLLDVKVGPGYPQNPWIYFTYVKPGNETGMTTLARAQLTNNELTGWQDLVITKSQTDTTRHFGSRIAFDEQGFVYFGIGDRGVRINAQDLSIHAGSILRVKLDGSAPPDNPFAQTRGALKEIWSYGVRNPQGLTYDPQRKILWEIEHGPRGGDEINIIERGKNYGWPVISYGREYWGPIAVGEGTHREGMEQPAKYYVPSIAPSSLIVYSGKVFNKWKGDLFAGALVLQHLNRVVVKDKKAVKEERLLKDLKERIRNVIEGPDGLLYLSTDSGKILLISPQ